MSKLSPILLFSLVFLGACSRPKLFVDPATVNPQKVQTILTTDSPQEQERCVAELEASGASILYRNEMGLILTDRAPSALELTGCRARVLANQKMKASPSQPTASSEPDLSTLLRLIPAEEIGARTFVKNHPAYDGRGVVVGILDTGIELDHPMLKKTTTGEDKVLDFNDMSGEGHVELAPAKADPDGGITGAGGIKYQAKSIKGTELRLGLFSASTLAQSDELQNKDKFTDLGVLVYQGQDGKPRARLDTNGDKSFDDETELSDFATSRLFTKIGAKKSLTVSVSFASDGKSVNLCFDDGSHGTHVAGIAAGYDPGGLQGVAPGAKIVAVKIGDNRLSGGSTTTASMMLAIDYAVQRGASIINLSYGIRAGSNIGASAIDQYVNKVAAEKGILFSIAAGNEGPGLLSLDTPGGASLAITNAAYISKQTARDNYGYLGVEDDNTWFFSSVGPRLDGGWKPSLLAPGTALSSVPLWAGTQANYRGTSMATPHVTGGLALLLSAARQASLPTDRISLTRAVYQSAKAVPTLSWIEQGHGLMNVPGALTFLQSQKSAPPVEYALKVTSPTAPDGAGSGVYVRSRQLGSNSFTVRVEPRFGPGVPDAVQSELHTYRLTATEPWIRVPSSFWLGGPANTFQLAIDPGILQVPGLHSGIVSAVDEKEGQTAFEVPVTIVSPKALDDSDQHTFQTDLQIRVGQTLRYFLDLPAGTTGAQIDLITDGPVVWGQLLDPAGKKVQDIRDPDNSAPQPAILTQANITQPGVYEIDLVAPATNARPAQTHLRVQAFSLAATVEGVMPDGGFTLTLQNSFEATKLSPSVQIRSVGKKRLVPVSGGEAKFTFPLTAQDVKDYASLRFTIVTAKEYYDRMTDYPYQLFDPDGKVAASGGLEPISLFAVGALDKLTLGQFTLDVQGAFTEKPPESWAFQLDFEKVLKNPIVLFSGKRLTLETGQTATLSIPGGAPAPEGAAPSCVTLLIGDGTGRGIQQTPVCP